jgi:hypothetical protein
MNRINCANNLKLRLYDRNSKARKADFRQACRAAQISIILQSIIFCININNYSVLCFFITGKLKQNKRLPTRIYPAKTGIRKVAKSFYGVL